MLSDEQMYERMAKGWRAGNPETICGNGSLRGCSERSRRAIPQWCEKYGIKTVADAGAGDLHYTNGIDWDIVYMAFDLIPRKPSVSKLDITTQQLPACDAILCRMVLNHLDPERILMALGLFRQSAKYLIATQFDNQKWKSDARQFCRLDLRHEPYRLGQYLESVQDGAEESCALCLWKL